MITCYSCNQLKPGEVAPFAICDDCKAGVEPPVNTAVPFTELPAPKHTKELTIVARWIETGQEASPCTHLVGNGLCLMMASWTCQICGQWTCNLHEAKDKNFQGFSICEECGKLSRFDQEQVYKFRTEMNSL